MAKRGRELQFATHQLVGVFLGLILLCAFVFLLGISMGSKKTALAAKAGEKTAKPTIPAGTIQAELDAHVRNDGLRGQARLGRAESRSRGREIGADDGQPGPRKAGRKPSKPAAQAAPRSRSTSPPSQARRTSRPPRRRSRPPRSRSRSSPGRHGRRMVRPSRRRR